MKRNLSVHVALGAILVCGAALAQPAAPAPKPSGAAAPVPPAQPPPVMTPAPRAMPPAVGGLEFSQNPFDILFRYFPPSEEAARKIAVLRQECDKERAAVPERIEQDLEAKYGGELLQILDDKQKADLARISAAVKSYWAAVKEADRAYSEALTAAGAMVHGQWLPEDAILLLTVLPRTPGQPASFSQLSGEYQIARMRAVGKAREAAMASQGPEDKATPTERQQRAEKAASEASEKVRAEYTEKIAAALKGSPQEKSYADLVAALGVWQAKKKSARESLMKELPDPRPGLASPAMMAGPAMEFQSAPRRSIDIVGRYLAPTREQEAKLRILGMEWQKTAQQMRAEADRQLDAKYAGVIADSLQEPAKTNYKRAGDAIAAYRASLVQAEEAYRDAWTKARLNGFWSRATGMRLAAQLPDLTPEQRQAMIALQSECMQQLSRERSKIYGAAKGQGDARAAAEAIEKQVDAQYVDKALAALGDTPQGKSLRVLNDARLAYAAQEKELLEKVTAELKAVVGEDRLNPRPPMPPVRPVPGIAPDVAPAPAAVPPATAAPKTK